MFEQFNIPKKIQVFEEYLKKQILSGKLKTDFDVYSFSLEQGFLPKHANATLNLLKSERKIDFEFNTATAKIHKIINPSTIKIF